MTNQVGHKVGRGSAPAHRDTTHWKWLGYTDVQQGLGFRKEYDEQKAHLQRNYEHGRALAVVVMRDWGQIPQWRRSEKLDRCFDRDGLTPDVWETTQEETRYHLKRA